MPRYRVTGPHKVAGYQTGEEFEHTFPEVQEQRLLDAGHLELVPAKPKVSTKTYKPGTGAEAALKEAAAAEFAD